MASTKVGDGLSYQAAVRWIIKTGKYLTPAPKVNSGSLATAVVIALDIFLPIYLAVTPDDASALLVASAATGVTAGLGVWIRARYNGKHRVD